MYAIVKNDEIVKLVPDSTGFSYNGIDYPANWIRLASPASRAALGIVDVVFGPEADQRFYWVSSNEPVYDAAAGMVRITFTATPKDLDQCKKVSVAGINAATYSILQPSDYRAVRSMEQGTPESQDWKIWRQEIRDQATAAKTAIGACTTIDELAALPPVKWIPDPNSPPQPEGV
jgi:hypothetical protein